jgi:predicted hotdog family 3-hydroxylacyl-ACP dehydratase
MSYPEVAELLPHEAPMVLLDEVCDFDGERARCKVAIDAESMFVDQGRMRAAVALEYMAQCVGVCTSLRGRARGEPPGSGYLVGARELRFETSHFDVGEELLVEATLTYDGRELGSFACTVTRGDELVASGTLNVYRQRPEEDR